jgi:hypothetical protein
MFSLVFDVIEYFSRQSVGGSRSGWISNPHDSKVQNRGLEIHDLMTNGYPFQGAFLTLDPIELKNLVRNPYGILHRALEATDTPMARVLRILFH